MDNYISGDRCTYETFNHDGREVHAVTRIREGEEGLTLVVLDISDKEKTRPVPSSDWLDVSRAIRRQLLERSQNGKGSKTAREIFKKLLEKEMYFINNEIYAGKASGNPGVYAYG